MALTNAEKEEKTTLENLVTSLKQQLSDKIESLDAAHKSGAIAEEQRANAVKALAAEKEAHAETTAERDSLSDELEEAGETITDLNTQLSKAQSGTSNTVANEVEHDGKTYRVVIPKFNTIHGSYEAADVTTGSDVLAHLVKIKSGVLEEVEAE